MRRRSLLQGLVGSVFAPAAIEAAPADVVAQIADSGERYLEATTYEGDGREQRTLSWCTFKPKFIMIKPGPGQEWRVTIIRSGG